ncbi:caspase family protein [Methylobacterium sp. NEAU 140]|uniref:caspase family protein n=1 Tax=Methylobacterium sp. NEAU 140 TaxID=3064945 RepID=UPI0027334EA6|nr:caspase family protein [Methylobacterium sp. NEAU 140]MDP4026999.1 caspase family protein [Methylobacterium sp. NEAU 140]
MRALIKAFGIGGGALRLVLMTFVGLLSTLETEAAPERRVALVIGNAAYQTVPTLDNPLPDSKAVAASLKRIGFEVVEGYDLRLDAMRALIGDYAAKLDGAKVALVYYAGHGVSVAGENYLLPTDAVLRSEADLDFRTMNINLVMRQMQREDRVNVVILDACRDNPFAKELARTIRTRSASVGTGLAEIATNSAAGTMIAFATDPGRTALDGASGQNSPFTAALLKHIETPGISISAVMDRVREDVWRATNEKQRPWVNTSIIGEFYLNPVVAPTRVATADPTAPLPAATPIAAQNPQVLEMKLWEAAERSGQPEDYRAYLDAHPTGYFAQIARNRLARAGGSTSRAADADLKEPATPAAEADLKLSQTERIETQVRLKALGFDPGGASGTFGPGTRRALSNWQKTRGIAASGFLNRGQRVALWEQSEGDYRKLAAARPPEPKARTVSAPRPARVAPMEARAQAAPPPPPQPQPQPRSGPSLGEMGSFLGGVGNLVGAVRR